MHIQPHTIHDSMCCMKCIAEYPANQIYLTGCEQASHRIHLMCCHYLVTKPLTLL